MLHPSEIIVPDWPVPAGVRALITTRNGGVSCGAYASLNLGLHVGDDASAVIENRRRLVALLPAEPVWLNQVHGTRVHPIDSDSGNAIIPADAAVTKLAARPCAVLVADCLPILFCAVDGNCVAAAHAGWRGLAAGVIEKTVEAMQVSPKQVMAYLGPAIGPSAFEVGQDVLEAFRSANPAAVRAFLALPGGNGKFHASLHELARQRLGAIGVARVYGEQACTVSAPDRYFSYRRDGQTGRMAAVIWRD